MPAFVTDLKFWGTAVLVVTPLITILLIVLGIAFRRRSSAIKKWPTAPGTVLASRVAAIGDGDGGTVFQPRVTYTYEINGKTYQSETFDLSDLTRGVSGTPRRKAQAKADLYQPGNSVPVYYDPAQPQRSILEVTTPGLMIWFLFGMAAFSLCTGIGGGVALIVGSSFMP